MIANFFWVYFAWFGLVIFNDVFIPFAIVLIILHLFLMVKEPLARWIETKLILAITVIGVVVDSTLTMTSVFVFSSDTILISGVTPVWLIVLWACFATTLSHSLSLLAKRKFLQFFTGAVFAPISYFAGKALGAVEFTYPYWVTFGILALVWAATLMLCFQLQQYLFNGVTHD